jgi:1-acyl-sn-glycerol-3-phosphate acyltransferase
MALIRTVFIFAITIFTMIIYFPAALLFFFLSFFGLKQPMAFAIHKIAQLWARLLVVLTRCPMTVTGRENIPRKGPLCFVSNHVGVFDIILALGYAGRPFGFIAKKELLLLPGINIWIYLLGGLFIDRKRPRNAIKTINRGINQIKSGAAMLIFPEGTRSKGGGLAPFLPGALKLASQSEALIVPMAITGSYDVFEKTHRVRAVPVSVSFLPPIDTAALPPADRKIILAEKLHRSIAEVLETHTPPMVS